MRNQAARKIDSGRPAASNGNADESDLAFWSLVRVKAAPPVDAAETVERAPWASRRQSLPAFHDVEEITAMEISFEASDEAQRAQARLYAEFLAGSHEARPTSGPEREMPFLLSRRCAPAKKAPPFLPTR